MSIVSDTDINTWLGLTDGTSDSDMAESIRDEVEALVKNFCARDFEETTYNAEVYNGTGRKELILKQYPIIRVKKLAIGTVNALKVYNANTSATTAFARVYQARPSAVSKLILTEDGSDTDIDFSTYDTLSKLHDAIETNSNWYAEIQSTDYEDFKSTELIATPDLYCLNPDYAMFEIPDEYISEFLVYEEEGKIRYSGGFPKGNQNVFVTYTAGYSSSDMPKDLQLAIKIIVQDIYKRRKEDDFGLSQIRLGDLAMNFEANCPSQALAILKRYQRRDFWFGGQ